MISREGGLAAFPLFRKDAAAKDHLLLDEAAVKAEVRKFLDEMLKAATEKYAALGDGEDIRLAGEGIAGGALRNCLREWGNSAIA